MSITQLQAREAQQKTELADALAAVVPLLSLENLDALSAQAMAMLNEQQRSAA